ncbi:MAG: YCF48-related protein [Gemmatimonadales bacterium]
MISPRRLLCHPVTALLVAGLALIPVALPAQKPLKKAAAVDPKLKGIWEAVNYPADVYLNDVYFATPEVGWVTAGAHGRPGMIIHTRDGGTSWIAQLGDPESNEPSFHDLRFIDATHGWALQDATIAESKLLSTSDGQTWSQTGTMPRGWGITDYTFISEREGLYLDGNTNVSRIMRTSDGGRTWNEVFACKATLEVEGLTKNLDCSLKTLHFPSPQVGYALGGANGAKRTLFVVKTEDGGQTWKLSAVPNVGGDSEASFDQEAFFTNEATGVVRLSDNQLYRTADGGQTWKGVVGTAGPVIQFADPLVGWSFSSYRTLNYTTDGGNRWLTRELPFPAPVAAFSLPRRDRAFVVGDHGMVYRYRLLASGETAAAKSLPAPAMPVFDSPLDEQVGGLTPIVDALEQAVASAPDSPAGPGAAAPAAAAPEEAGVAAAELAEDAAVAEEEDALGMSAFTTDCCAKPLGKFDLILTAVTGIVPQFLGQYKNTNLLLAGLRMLTDLPGRVNDLNLALRSFRAAPDKAAAQTALAQLTAAIQGLTQSTAVAFQKQLPSPVEESGEAGAAAAVEENQVEGVETGAAADAEMVPADAEATPADEEAEPTPGPAEQSAEETPPDDGLAAEAARAAEEEAKKTAKEKLGQSIKKKLRF